MWPSEGSVSDALLELIPDNFAWLATDEGILARSLGTAIERDGDGYVKNAGVLYQPYRKGKLALVFRDEFLADQLSFKYQYVSAQDAANDLVSRLHTIHERLGDDEHAYLVPIVMDGENAWEAYENNGDDFFRALYTLCSNDPTLATVTVSEFLKANPPRAEIPRLAAGSWINANFDTWIGGPAHNRAWELLEMTREALAAAQVDGDRVRQAWDALYVAEGSDWFWWYSPRNSSKQDEIFDELFRTHLRRVYEIIGASVPGELSEAIRKVRATSRSHFVLVLDSVIGYHDNLIVAGNMWQILVFS
jgi:alpha-amylase/alpha-mannosidase (GH57 family)